MHGKTQKSQMEKTNSKYQLLHAVISSNYLMNHILYQLLKIILSISSKKHKPLTDNLPIRIYINRIESGIRFRIKSGYYLEFLTPEIMELLGSTKTKIY